MVVRSESGAAAMRQKALNALARDVAAAQAEADFGRALSYAVRACEEAAAVAASVLTARGESAQGTARERFARLADLGVLEPALAARLQSLAGFPALAVRQCRPAEALMVETVIRDELAALTEFAAIARRA